VSCPKCETRIAYLHLAIEPTGSAATGAEFEWVPRQVGEFLKKRYAGVWD
jgi:hypothetical protein